jgi:hypothetical protein
MWKLLAASTSHIARQSIANQIGDAIETAATPAVRKIKTDNAAAKNAIAQIRSANGRLSMSARLSRPSIERDIPPLQQNFVCCH